MWLGTSHDTNFCMVQLHVVRSTSWLDFAWTLLHSTVAPWSVVLVFVRRPWDRMALFPGTPAGSVPVGLVGLGFPCFRLGLGSYSLFAVFLLWLVGRRDECSSGDCADFAAAVSPLSGFLGGLVSLIVALYDPLPLAPVFAGQSLRRFSGCPSHLYSGSNSCGWVALLR